MILKKLNWKFYMYMDMSVFFFSGEWFHSYQILQEGCNLIKISGYWFNPFHFQMSKV